MNNHDFEVEILVNGRPIKTYKHRGQFFVEGRRGSAYELKIYNNTWNQVEVVPSVDGLSVMRDGPAGPDDSGYLIPSRSSIVIPGFRRDNSNVAEFVFADKRDSYSEATGQGTENVGVIGFMVFREKVMPTGVIVTPSVYHSWNSTDSAHDPILRHSSISHTVGSSAGTLQNSISSSGTIGSADVKGMVSSNCVQPDSFSLGTDWGDEKTHRVQEVSFNRENPHHPDEIITIYYDEKRGLEKRGIRVGKPSRKTKPTTPNAFPGYSETGCSAPPGWRGRRRR